MAITFQDIFSTANLTTYGTPLTAADIVVAIAFSFLTGLFIFWIYRKTYSGILYSKNFNVTLIMATMVASVVIMAIGGNLALSLGMVGALSIIRFRTPVKDTKDLTFLFWAVAAGIVNGVRFYKLSIISSLMIGTVLFVFSKKFRVLHQPYVLILKYSNMDESKLDSVLKRFCSKFEVRNTMVDDSGSAERTIEVRIKSKDTDSFLKELKNTKGVNKAMLFSHTGELSE